MAVFSKENVFDWSQSWKGKSSPMFAEHISYRNGFYLNHPDDVFVFLVALYPWCVIRHPYWHSDVDWCIANSCDPWGFCRFIYRNVYHKKSTIHWPYGLDTIVSWILLEICSFSSLLPTTQQHKHWVDKVKHHLLPSNFSAGTGWTWSLAFSSGRTQNWSCRWCIVYQHAEICLSWFLCWILACRLNITTTSPGGEYVVYFVQSSNKQFLCMSMCLHGRIGTTPSMVFILYPRQFMRTMGLVYFNYIKPPSFANKYSIDLLIDCLGTCFCSLDGCAEELPQPKPSPPWDG